MSIVVLVSVVVDPIAVDECCSVTGGAIPVVELVGDAVVGSAVSHTGEGVIGVEIGPGVVNVLDGDGVAGTEVVPDNVVLTEVLVLVSESVVPGVVDIVGEGIDVVVPVFDGDGVVPVTGGSVVIAELIGVSVVDSKVVDVGSSVTGGDVAVVEIVGAAVVGSAVGDGVGSPQTLSTMVGNPLFIQLSLVIDLVLV